MMAIGRIYGIGSRISGRERGGINGMIKAFNNDNSYFAGCVGQHAVNVAYLLAQLRTERALDMYFSARWVSYRLKSRVISAKTVLKLFRVKSF